MLYLLPFIHIRCMSNGCSSTQLFYILSGMIVEVSWLMIKYQNDFNYILQLFERALKHTQNSCVVLLYCECALLYPEFQYKCKMFSGFPVQNFLCCRTDFAVQLIHWFMCIVWSPLLYGDKLKSVMSMSMKCQFVLNLFLVSLHF